MADEIVNTDVKGEEAKQEAANAPQVIVKHVPVAARKGSEDELIEGQAENYTDDTTGKGENMIPKSRFDQVLEQRKRATDALRTVADEMVEDVPEEFRDIIPDLEPAAKITWIRNALKKGLFNRQVVNGLDSKRPSGKQPLDFSNMTPQQMMVHGYK
ncbi:MAG: hypothetical protein K9N21_10450 [Deltaproteobacteria bacterium]|nr:hypothetical protein [Deltaproteobacteria bacterium]